MQSPYFSVIICTYNRDKYIEATLESIANQDYPIEKYEILIIDNNSTDKTSQISAEFENKHPNLTIRYILETQQGISYGRNRGVAEAKGVFIAFIDDDETIDPDYLSNLEDFFNSHSEALLSGGPVIPVYETEKPIWLSRYTLRLITGAYDKGPKVKLLGEKDYPGTGHATLKRELFTKYGMFNTELGRKGKSLLGAEDKDFFLRLMQNDVKCYYVPSAKIYHHIPASKLTEEFFNRLTYSIGVSERIRTISESKKTFYKRLLSEAFKWAASFILFFYYTFTFQFPKGKKLLQFRCNVTKGLLTKQPDIGKC